MRDAKGGDTWEKRLDFMKSAMSELKPPTD
jgi:hypothetical protein